MEIFQIPRILIYEDRGQLSDYEVEDNRSINHLLYNFLNQTFSSIQDMTSLFNDAYYICTLILMDDSPLLKQALYFTRCSVIFCILL